MTLLLGLAGCAGVASMEAGQTAMVGDGVSLTPDRGWSQIKLNQNLLWTINGVGLDEIHIHTGIVTDKPLYAVSGMTTQLGHYNDAMLPNDIQDLLVRTMSQESYGNVRATGLSPCPFGAAAGFCFQTSFSTRDGLEMKGKVIGARMGKKLELIEFRAPAEYYYDTLSPAVDKLFASVRTQ